MARAIKPTSPREDSLSTLEAFMTLLTSLNEEPDGTARLNPTNLTLTP